MDRSSISSSPYPYKTTAFSIPTMTIPKELISPTKKPLFMSTPNAENISPPTKDMINVGGYKVFSSKVEETLARHPAIDMIALVGVENPQRPGSELVKAFLQLDPGHGHEGDANALKQDIIRFAKESCSPYEVPRVIEIIEEMPLTAVGQVDKKLLRKRKA